MAEGKIRSHRDLVVWQKAVELVVMVYEVTKTYPRDELYGLTNQTRRAAVSIPANIAEGQGRRMKGEYRQCLGNSRGSLLELDTHLEIGLRLSYLNSERHARIQDRIQEVGRLTNGLLRSLS